ncbi:hypothetical protein GCM10027440_42960 [Nocardiopsis coralliicola]
MATTAVLIPALAAFYPAQAPETAPAEPEAGDSPLILDAITPRAVESGDTLRITGQVSNTADEPLDDLSVRLRYSSVPFYERGQLTEFAEGEGTSATPSVGPDTEIPDALEPGDASAFTLTAKEASLDLDGFGVFPMAVELVDGSGDAVASVRTFLPYAGEDAPSKVDIAWVWPLMDYPRRTDDNTYLSTDLASSVGPQGRLGRLLVAGAQDDAVTLQPGDLEEEEPEPSPSPTASDSPRSGTASDTTAAERTGSGSTPITWAVDPSVLSDIERMSGGAFRVLDDPAAETGGQEPPTTAHEASPAAQLWLQEARSAVSGGSVIATPYADPDIPAMLDADLEGDLNTAVRIGGDSVQRTLGTKADPAYALPPGGVADGPTYEFLAEHGADRFLLSEAAMPAQDWVDHTPSAGAPLTVDAAPDGEATGLVADAGITEALAMPSRGAGEGALAQQRFIAETAMIGGEEGGDRTVVAMPPATWNPGADFASGVLAATGELPWLDAVELDDVEASGDAGAERSGPSNTAANESRLDSDHMAEVEEVRGRVRLFNSILVEDIDPFRPAVLRASSAAWREEEGRGALAVGLIHSSVETSLGKVRIIPTDPVTLASKSGTIGVIIANDLQGEHESVRVKLSISSENSERMSIEDYTDEMEIGPGRKTTVYVPLNARINGRTMIYQSLQNTQGEPITAEETITQVSATGLGNQAMIISGVGALVLIAALAPRALRKWGRRRDGGGAETAAAAGGAEGGDPGEEDGAAKAGEDGSSAGSEGAAHSDDSAAADGESAPADRTADGAGPPEAAAEPASASSAATEDTAAADDDAADADGPAEPDRGSDPAADAGSGDGSGSSGTGREENGGSGPDRD